jgi:putative ABC transport system permease protein
VIFNASAAKLAGWKNPIDKHIVYPGGDNKRFKVIGIAKDFNALSLHDQITPWAVLYQIW